MLLIVASSALPQSLTTESFAKAKAVLDRSVAAYGGTEEMFVAYFPAQKLIFQGDLLQTATLRSRTTLRSIF